MFHASIIADGNASVDEGDTAATALPLNDRAQGRHFNRSPNEMDSRIAWGEIHLGNAIDIWHQADIDFAAGNIDEGQRHAQRRLALTELGMGLHSIQDVHSHGNIGIGEDFASHVGMIGVDNIDYNWADDTRTSVVKTRGLRQGDGSIVLTIKRKM